MTDHDQSKARPGAHSAGQPTVASNSEDDVRVSLPLRQDDNIEGNVLAGFNEDHQTLLFLHFADQASGQACLRALQPRIATSCEVANFNARFRSARHAALHFLTPTEVTDPERFKLASSGRARTLPD